jgi:hypothetical protein
MQTKKLGLDQLSVNRANDRHGELENETAAIAWLFNNREAHMRNLAQDIVSQKDIYELPLVSRDGESYRVFDGNRRVTCLKLIKNPQRAPTQELQEFFKALRDRWQGEFPSKWLCQVENDRDRVDEILFRRHTGTQNGIGQSTWDDRMKATFIARTGKGTKANIADAIEARLKEARLLPAGRKIPRSTLSRLLSAEPFRNRVGISFEKGQMLFTHTDDVVLVALSRIASDLSSRAVVLGDIWDVDGKSTYLNQLDDDGVLPTSADLKKGPDGIVAEPLPKVRTPTGGGRSKPATRTTLIPKKDFGILWPGRLQRHHEIWEELQNKLDLLEHINAISVLFRVLLELSIENYILQAGVAVQKNDKLANKVEKVAKDLKAKGQIEDKYFSELKKFNNADQIVSADTLNRYVHSPDFAPSPKHLTSTWDSLATLIVHCIRA